MARIVRFAHDDGPRYGVIDGTEVAVIEPHPFVASRPTGERIPIEGLTLLAPVIPTKIIAVGRNYRAHAAELGGEVPDEPLLFLKPTSAVIGPGEPIRLPVDRSSEVHHEAELAVVIGALLQRVTREQAQTGILGYTAANDVTARDLQRSEEQWFRAKGFDSFCPLGPAIATDIDPSDLRIRCLVDGQVRQDGRTSQLVFDVPGLVAEISQVVTLLPGDVVLTGTPAGVGPLVAGSTVSVEVEGVGTLENPVVDRPPFELDVRPRANGEPSS